MTKVLYVIGRGRSGSTIFSNVIGAHDGFFPIGELRYLWDPIIREDVPCACGETVSSCPIWSNVIDRLEDVSVEAASRLQRQVVSERNLLRLLRYRWDGSWEELEAYVDLTARVYRAIQEISGASVIVDSSKRPSYGGLLRQISSCDLYWIHLIRDPRASAYSWGHSRHESIHGTDTEVRRRGPIDSTIRWDILNIEAELLLRKVPTSRALRLRYEDFVANPKEFSAHVIGLTGEEGIPSPFEDERTIFLKGSHTLGGNPSKLSVGRVVIGETTDWVGRQKNLDRRLATAVAFPFLRRYGYGARLDSPALR